MDARISRSACVAAIGLLTPLGALAGTTWWVTNQGLDSASCGSRDRPCRSISAAIDKAVNGDVIEVGAGSYGDLNGDGAFTAPGEEHYSTSYSGRSCIVCISKDIKLLSLHGAEDTIIDAGNNRRSNPADSSGRVDDVVALLTSGITLGTTGGGFTVAGSGGNGVHVDFNSTGVKVIGNTARGNAGSGFAVDVVDESVPVPFPVPISQYTFDGNTATANGTGFSVSHDETHPIPERLAFTGNVATGNTSNSIRNNNIYGNRGVGSTANCGIVNSGFESAAPTPTLATNNYWGSTSGPGADPADNAGKGCDFNQGTTVIKPFATTAYGISP
jgi:hypothetical protein